MSIKFSTKTKIRYGILPLFAISALPYASGQEGEELERIEEAKEREERILLASAKKSEALSDDFAS